MANADTRHVVFNSVSTQDGDTRRVVLNPVSTQDGDTRRVVLNPVSTQDGDTREAEPNPVSNPEGTLERVYFRYGHTENSILSNLSPVQLRYGQRMVRSSEHMYQARKCWYLGRYRLAQQVLTAQTGIEAKRRVREIPRVQTNEWRKDLWDGAIPSMMEVVIDKVNQCEGARRILDSHPTAYFVEDTQDKFWGAGSPHFVTDLTDAELFQGQNWMGKTLTAINLYRCGATEEIVRKVVRTGLELCRVGDIKLRIAETITIMARQALWNDIERMNQLGQSSVAVTAAAPQPNSSTPN